MVPSKCPAMCIRSEYVTIRICYVSRDIGRIYAVKRNMQSPVNIQLGASDRNMLRSGYVTFL